MGEVKPGKNQEKARERRLKKNSLTLKGKKELKTQQMLRRKPREKERKNGSEGEKHRGIGKGETRDGREA